MNENHQDHDFDMNNDEVIPNGIDSVIEFKEVELCLDVLQRLKKNDPTITDIEVTLHRNDDGECYFNSINWKEDGNCIVNNSQLKKIHIYGITDMVFREVTFWEIKEMIWLLVSNFKSSSRVYIETALYGIEISRN